MIINMLNGINTRFDNIKGQLPTDFTNSENLTESYELQMFSLKEICPDSSGCADHNFSPNFKGLRMKGLWRLDENSVNTSGWSGRRVIEDIKSSVGTSITEFRLASMYSPERQKYMEEVLGCSPCAVFCGCCKKYVQSIVEIGEEQSPGYLTRFAQAFFMCCGSNENRVIFHKCPYCGLTLGKT